MKTSDAEEIKPGMKVHCYGDVGTVIRIKLDGLAAVHFTGKTTEGKFGQVKGGCDVLIKNLRPLSPKT